MSGINYCFFYSLTFFGMLSGLEALLRERREEVMVATGTEDRDPGEMDAYLDRVRRRLKVDVIDVFFAEYVSPEDDMGALLGKGGAIEQIQKWKAEGKVRYAAATSHNRPLAVELIESGRIDVLMHRYNMAHRGAEERVLPAAVAAEVPVVSFTNTRWGSLLKGHPHWDGPAPTAADCYRFVLRHPAVRVAMTAPATVAQLEENLAALTDEGAPDAETAARWETYGKLIYGDGKDAFETEYP